MNYEWKIKLFAGLPERIGTSVILITLAEDQLTSSMLKRHIIEIYPQHASVLQASFIACNHAYAQADTILAASDELALLPPVSGGEDTQQSNPLNQVTDRSPLNIITTKPIDAEEVLAKVIRKENGASLVFVGTTREFTEGKRTTRLSYEAYEPMAITTMQQIGDEIADRWQGVYCAITHRIGVVELAEASVVIAVSSPHRSECYEASRYAIDRLKQIVPIWKKEIWEDGSEWKGHQQGPWNPLQNME